MSPSIPHPVLHMSGYHIKNDISTVSVHITGWLALPTYKNTELQKEMFATFCDTDVLIYMTKTLLERWKIAHFKASPKSTDVPLVAKMGVATQVIIDLSCCIIMAAQTASTCQEQRAHRSIQGFYSTGSCSPCMYVGIPTAQHILVLITWLMWQEMSQEEILEKLCLLHRLDCSTHTCNILHTDKFFLFLYHGR